MRYHVLIALAAGCAASALTPAVAADRPDRSEQRSERRAEREQRQENRQSNRSSNREERAAATSSRAAEPRAPRIERQSVERSAVDRAGTRQQWQQQRQEQRMERRQAGDTVRSLRERPSRRVVDATPVAPVPSTVATPRHSYTDRHHDWSRNWRDDHRYDWRSYRNRHGSIFRIGRYYDPYGSRYRRWSIGFSMMPFYYRSNYWLDDPWMYRLPPAYGPYRWVRYYDDALLVNIYTGRVVDVIYGFFW